MERSLDAGGSGQAVLLALSLACLSVGPPHGPARADAPAPAVDPAPLGDPLDAAAWAARRGDAAVLDGLAEGRPPAVQLRAAFASRWIREPERALPRLGALAGGRDPRVAPGAAAAALEISQALDPRELEAREVPLAVLRDGRAAFEELAGDESARPDIARLAAFTAAHLASLIDPQ